MSGRFYHSGGRQAQQARQLCPPEDLPVKLLVEVPLPRRLVYLQQPPRVGVFPDRAWKPSERLLGGALHWLGRCQRLAEEGQLDASSSAPAILCDFISCGEGSSKRVAQPQAIEESQG